MAATQMLLHRPPARTRQRLSATDHVLWMADRAVRRLGGPGFETQTVLRLKARLDADRLQSALDRLGEQYPVVTARLQVAENESAAWWRFMPGARCRIREKWLDSSRSEDVLNAAAALLTARQRLSECDPISFYVLHCPDERDVFIAQYNHTLLDNNAAIPLLAHLNVLADEAASPNPPPGHDSRFVRRHLTRFDCQRRRRAMRDASRSWSRSLRGGVVQLGEPLGRTEAPVELRIQSRQLEPSDVNAFRQRVIETCGFPNLSMAILASAFRAIAQLAPLRPAAKNLMAGIGLDLGIRSKPGPLFGNPVSAVPIRATPEDIVDRDKLVRILGRQFREHLQSNADIGILQLMPFLSRRPADAEVAINLAMREGFSLWYACFGSTDAIGTEFCGAGIEDVFFTGPAWPPMGLTLLVNQFRGRLLFQATFVPACVSEETVARFLDEMMRDLLASRSC